MIIGQKEIYEYLKKHPKAQNPLMYERHFGGEKILEIVRNAKGREIKFTRPNKTYDKASFEYIGEPEQS